MAASKFVKLYNHLTRSHQTVPTASRSFSTSRHARGSLNLFYEGYQKKENEEETTWLSVSLTGQREKEEEGVKSTCEFNLLNRLKKKEFNYSIDGLTATMKDGVCQINFPDKKQKFEIKLE